MGWVHHCQDRTIKSLLDLRNVHPSLVESYCQFLIERPVTHGTVGNYLNGLLNLLRHVSGLQSNADDESEPDSDEEADDGAIETLIEATFNLRAQAEKQAKIEKLYRPRHAA